MPIPHFQHSRPSARLRPASRSWRQVNAKHRRRPMKPPRMPRQRAAGIGGFIRWLLPYAFIAAAAGIFVVITLFAWCTKINTNTKNKRVSTKEKRIWPRVPDSIEDQGP